MIKNISFEPGFIVIETDQVDSPRRYSAKRFLQAADIPDLTLDSLTLLTTLAQVVMILVQTLIENETIGEELIAGFNIQYLLDTLIDSFEAEAV